MALESAAMDSADDLQLAFDTSDLAAELALAHFESGVSATLKADGTPVTEADRAVERLLRETLSEARPEDAFLGEELGQLGESDRVWILDPIDGTWFFSRGDPNWRIHIALEVQGTTEVALVTSPALRRCWWATRGGGSFESSWPREESKTRRLEVSTTSTLADAVLDAAGRRVQSSSPTECGSRTGEPPTAGRARSWRDRCLLGRVLPHLGSRAVGSPCRGSRRPLHRSNRWTFERSGRRPVLERHPAQSATRCAALPGASLTGQRRALRPPRHCACTREPAQICPVSGPAATDLAEDKNVSRPSGSTGAVRLPSPHRRLGSRQR